MKKLAGIILLLTVFTAGSIWIKSRYNLKPKADKLVAMPTITPTQMPTPSIKKMSFAEMNKYYGPCATVNVLMYHHIQPEAEAKANGQTGLSVSPEWFRKHQEYLKGKGYSIINIADIADFFDSGKGLPSKAVVVTLDDAYEDNYTNAWPIIREFGTKATIFTPSGLVNVTNYLTWGNIAEMASSGLIYFGNHTWSHHSSAGPIEEQDKEIRLADGQLAEKGLNAGKVFAYPYGKPSSGAEEVLNKYGYKLAFTTVHGNMMCKGKRFELPRVRVGNAPLSNYGL